MAQNRQVELDHADSSSSEDDQQEGSSEELEGSESEEEEENKTSPPTTKKPTTSKKPEAVPKPSSSDESGSEPESDAEVDPEIKPIASKPMQKARSKPAAGVKRQGEIETSVSKRAKKTVDDSKKQLFQRLWSEDDEIVILKGMIDYRSKKNADPVADMNAFLDFIKKSLHIDVSKTQLSDKIRRLKKKYENNAVKEKKGKERTLAKPHEQKAYDLSKKIWGNDKKNQTPKVKEPPLASPKLNKMEKNSSSKKEVLELEGENKNVALSQSIQLSKLSTSTIEAPLGVERIIKDRLDLIDESKKMELDEKWKKLHLEEVELYLRRVELIQEQTKLVLDSFKSAEN